VRPYNIRADQAEGTFVYCRGARLRSPWLLIAVKYLTPCSIPFILFLIKNGLFDMKNLLWQEVNQAALDSSSWMHRRTFPQSYTRH